MKLQLKKLHIYFIAFIALVLPNIVFLKKIPQPLDSIYYMAFPKGEINMDFFSYYKMLFLLVSTGFLLIIFALNRWKNLKWHKSYTFLIIYAFFIILSTIDSPFRELAIRGLGDRYEGMSTLLAYLLLFFVVHSSIEEKSDIKIILGGIIGGSLIVGGIGIFQYFGFDFFRSDLGKSLILPKAYESVKGTLKFQFGKYTIYSTLYNTNFVGSYMIMMLFLGIGLVLKNKNNNIKYHKYLSYAYSIFIFANLIGCRSRAGFLGTQATIIFALIFFFRYVKHYWKELITLAASFVTVFLIMNYAVASGSLGKKLLNINTGRNTIRDVYSKDGYLYFESTYGNMKMKQDGYNISFYDLDNNKLGVFSQKETIEKNGKKIVRDILYFKDKKYENFNFILDSNSIFFLYDKKINMPIFYHEGKYKTLGLGNKLYELVKIERFKLFDGREKTGSHRVYIWSRTIPLLKYTLFSGYGPDTFSLVFPQNDNFGKSISFGIRNIIVDKPHNMYLQLGVNTGGLSLINFIVACAFFLVSGILAFNKEDFKEKSLSFALYLGSIGYLVTGLFNDSLVSVAPIFWIYWAVAVYLLFDNFRLSLPLKKDLTV